MGIQAHVEDCEFRARGGQIESITDSEGGTHHLYTFPSGACTVSLVEGSLAFDCRSINRDLVRELLDLGCPLTVA